MKLLKILKTRKHLLHMKKCSEMMMKKNIIVYWNDKNSCEMSYDEICQLIEDFDKKYFNNLN